jgi:5'-nucleotidase
VSKNIQAIYNESEKTLASLSVHGKPVQPDHQYTICLQEYYCKNSERTLGVMPEEFSKFGAPKVITTSAQDVLEEYFTSNQLINSYIDGRLIYK